MQLASIAPGIERPCKCLFAHSPVETAACCAQIAVLLAHAALQRHMALSGIHDEFLNRDARTGPGARGLRMNDLHQRLSRALDDSPVEHEAVQHDVERGLEREG